MFLSLVSLQRLLNTTLALALLTLLPFSNAWAEKSLRISSDELVKSLDQNQYVILDARSPTMYSMGHIDGARSFPVDWTYERKKSGGQIIEPDRIQVILRNLGVNINTPIVVYDDGSLVDAARLFWTLEVYGLKNVKVLSAGYDRWLEHDHPISLDKPQVDQSTYVPVINHKRLATKFSTQIATRSPNQVIIDARPFKAYQGEVSAAKRFGHIPKAQSIPASHNINTSENTAQLQSLDELEKLYSDIPKNKKVIIYCAIGRISATNYLALRELGYDVSNYDASWKEWGNDFSLPIIGPNK